MAAVLTEPADIPRQGEILMKNNPAFSPAPFTVGVNLSGWLERRTADDVRADMFSRGDFENIRSLGCNVIRLPIHFERFCDPAAGYAVAPKIMDILDRAASWAEALDMRIIFDFHNATNADSFTPPDVENVLFPVWEQLAAHCKGRFPNVIFEVMNEPHGIETDRWNRIILNVFRRIRGMDAERYIVVGGANWNSLEGMKALPAFEDSRVIYTFHFYDPHTFTHQGAPWCHMERVTGIPFPYDPERMPPMPDHPTETEERCFRNYPAEGTLEAVRRQFEEFSRFSAERQAPVFCGEFGCNMFAVSNAERINWYRIVTGLMEEYRVPRISWDYYGGFGLFTREPFAERRRPEFPGDLNSGLLEAMRLKNPLASGAALSSL